MADILRRHQAEPPPEPAPLAVPPPDPELRLPQPPRDTTSRRWHRHELPRIGGYELRLDGEPIVRVAPSAKGWQVINLGAGSLRDGFGRNESDALAARIARMAAVA